ncbi:MAG: hypothetical protein JWN66_2218 [Sphingomonas bacterium]|uniref:PAS domain-containing sensor histidine kinase n=1 Tax=Sphingomonas bacterium TaxID=1895847 RepID=UPI0026376EDF|nr:ATP-binding protein [Sphingomonas bacterium]MDB5705102.1 hypothetical protein [Sphingomonas bacterium]
MIESKRSSLHDDAGQERAEREVDRFRRALGPFVVAAEMTRMAMTFTNATEPGNPIIFANDSFLALTGFAQDEVVGQSFGFLMARVADPDALARIEAQFEEEATETIEVECRRRDGRPFLVAVRINPVRDRQGKIVQHCASFVDLSGHIERVRRERDALHALYQHTPDFIATTEGPEHRFSFANDAYQQLVGNRGILGESVAEAMPELVAQGFIAVLDRVYRSGQPFTGECVPVELQRETGQDGELRFIDFIYQAIRAPDGVITGIFCEGHDVSAQKQAADQVRTLQAEVIHLARVSAMGTMAATLAHELTQPLTAISNHVAVGRHLIEADGAGTEPVAGILSDVSDSARRACEIIRRLKDMTKRAKPARELFDLRDAVRETVALMRVGACERVLIADLSRDSTMIDADRIQIQQVIMNLIRNGCEAAAGRGDGRVTISTLVKEDRAIVSVRDNGAGVAPDIAGSLFEWADSTKPDGMGIGLSICRTIIDAHDGAIWLEESGSGGAHFRFSVPLA